MPNLSYKGFFIATLLGMAPMTFILTYLGDAIQINMFVTIALTFLVVIGFFVVPLFIRRYNLWGLKDRIRFE